MPISSITISTAFDLLQDEITAHLTGLQAEIADAIKRGAYEEVSRLAKAAQELTELKKELAGVEKRYNHLNRHAEGVHRPSAVRGRVGGGEEVVGEAGGCIMKAGHHRIHFEGKDYVWTGSDWYEATTCLTPPASLIRALNAEIALTLQQQDNSITKVPELISTACVARDSGQYARAELLIRRALAKEPDNLAARVVLSSILRVRGCPEQALAETDRFRSASDPALHTTRAAALCDLGRWEEAKREVARALAISRNEEAFMVVCRIKAAAPELYR